jgi:hypothetical protein
MVKKTTINFIHMRVSHTYEGRNNHMTSDGPFVIRVSSFGGARARR